ncbi:MAG: PQQ-dependent sugar dehydrogenase [Bacteroidota bacterium]
MKNLVLLFCCFLMWSCQSGESSNASDKKVPTEKVINKNARVVSKKDKETANKKGSANNAKKKEYEVLPLDKVNLPEGFKIEVYADGIKKARSLALSDKGTLYVGTMSKKGQVTALKGDQRYQLSDGWYLPNGVALKDGDLYVAEVSKIHKFKDIENNLDNPISEVIYDDYPKEEHHGWKFISFGPDGKLYVPVGAPCNICLKEDEVFASITRINDDGSNMEVVQHGIRNTVGFTWHPDSKDLWFTDNGRDWWGDDIPGCEINRAPKDGMHFGYPFCHQGNLAENDKKIPSRKCSEFTAPAQILNAHVAPLGIEFIPAGNFPKEYEKQILITEHGSWNRSKKQGYRLALLKMDGDKVTSYETFADGWLDDNDDSVWGRPVDLEFMPDGSLLVSDDMADVVYRIYYAG